MKKLILVFTAALAVVAVEAAEPIVKRNVVTFESSAIAEEIVSAKAKCPKLKHLNLRGCTVENGAALKELPKLKVSMDKKTVGL